MYICVYIHVYMSLCIYIYVYIYIYICTCTQVKVNEYKYINIYIYIILMSPSVPACFTRVEGYQRKSFKGYICKLLVWNLSLRVWINMNKLWST